MDSERQSRVIFVANLPSGISENDLIGRFESEGLVTARIIDEKHGYLLLAKKATAQRMHKNGSTDFYQGHSKSHQIQTLDISHVTKVGVPFYLMFDSKSFCSCFEKLVKLSWSV